MWVGEYDAEAACRRKIGSETKGFEERLLLEVDLDVETKQVVVVSSEASDLYHELGCRVDGELLKDALKPTFERTLWYFLWKSDRLLDYVVILLDGTLYCGIALPPVKRIQ